MESSNLDDEQENSILLALESVIEAQRKKLTDEVQQLRQRNQRLQQDAVSQREEFTKDCLRYNAVGNLAHVTELRNTKAALEKQEQDLLQECICWKRDLQQLLEKKQTKLEALQERNGALRAIVAAEEAEIASKRKELMHLNSTLCELDKPTELERLKYALESLDDVKAQLEDCVLGFRLQLSKIDGEDRLLSAQCSAAQRQLQHINAESSSTFEGYEGHRQLPVNERRARPPYWQHFDRRQDRSTQTFRVLNRPPASASPTNFTNRILR